MAGWGSWAASQFFRVCWNLSTLPWVWGWLGLPFFWVMPRCRSSCSKPLRPPLPPDSRVVNTMPLSVRVEAGAPCAGDGGAERRETMGPVTRFQAVTDRAYRA